MISASVTTQTSHSNGLLESSALVMNTSGLEVKSLPLQGQCRFKRSHLKYNQCILLHRWERLMQLYAWVKRDA